MQLHSRPGSPKQPQGHSYVAFLQGNPEGQKPAPAPYAKSLKTLGDHLGKKRLDRKLLQKEVAKNLGTTTTSIYNWENNLASPCLCFISKIIRFLGYLPNCIQASTVGEKIVLFRQILGVTQKELAHRLGIDPSTLGRWERDKSLAPKKHLERLNTLFTSLSSSRLSLPVNSILTKSLKRKGLG